MRRARRRQAGCGHRPVCRTTEARYLTYRELIVVVTIDVAVDRRPMVAHVVASNADDVVGTGHVVDCAIAGALTPAGLVVVVEIVKLRVAIEVNALAAVPADDESDAVVAVGVVLLVVGGEEVGDGVVASGLRVFG